MYGEDPWRESPQIDSDSGPIAIGQIMPAVLARYGLARDEPEEDVLLMDLSFLTAIPLAALWLAPRLEETLLAALLGDEESWVMPAPSLTGVVSFYEDFPYAWWSGFSGPADMAGLEIDMPAGLALEARYADISDQIERVYREADYVGSLVVGGASTRPTEYDGPKIEPAGWWDAFWKRFEGNTGVTQFEARSLWGSLRFYAGKWIESIRY